jgi:hypothetical protein
VCAFAAALAQTGPAGHWEGAIQLPDREMPITLDLVKDAKDAWTGAFGQPAQNVRNVPLSNVKYDGKRLTFNIGNGPQTPTFDCGVENAALQCTASNAQGSVPANLKRTGDAKIETPKASTAVSRELEGDWEGTIDTPNGPIPLVIHFQNQPDKTVKGTLDSPQQQAMALELTGIVQKDTAVQFELPMVGGSFKGTLNKEGTSITGDWSQGGGSLPLTLKKKAAK